MRYLIHLIELKSNKISKKAGQEMYIELHLAYSLFSKATKLPPREVQS